MVDKEVDKTSAVDCDCDLCTDAPQLCDCLICRSVRDEMFSLIGLSPNFNDDDLLDMEVHL